MLDENNVAQVVGLLIGIFEDFLQDKGVDIPNPEKVQALKDGEDPDSIANIYGTDYGCLQDCIEDVLRRWNMVKGGVNEK